jgi:hypothetical protein
MNASPIPLSLERRPPLDRRSASAGVLEALLVLPERALVAFFAISWLSLFSIS